MSNARELAELGGSYGSGGFVGMKNRIINGAMMIDQRNAGASVTNVSGATTYTLDRWAYYAAQASKFSVQQNAGAVTPPAGFTNYLGATSLSAYSVGAGDTFLLIHKVEGYNVADLAWGTANASAVTLTFRVYSSLTGTFGGSITNGAENRSYPFSYSVSSANTWTTVSITISGDTSGTWTTTNGAGLEIFFSLGAGSTYTGTANAWTASGKYSATGSVNVIGTNGATFYITGVQLEKGSTATSFDFRSYGTELALCQRYYWRWTSSAIGIIITGQVYNSTAVLAAPLSMPVTMRTTPTVSESAGSDFNPYTASGTNSPAFTTSGNWRAASPSSLYLDAQGSSGLTAGNASGIRHINGAWVAASAEL